LCERRRILSGTSDSWSRRINTTVKEGESLLDALESQGHSILSMCGGRGLCGKCKIVILKGSDNLTSVTQTEKIHLSDSDLKAGHRLACLAKSTSSTTFQIEIPPESEQTQQRFVISGLTPTVKLLPPIRKVFVRLRPPTLEDSTADLERLIGALRKKGKSKIAGIGHDTLKSLPRLLRLNDWKVTASIFKNKEIVGLEAGDKTGSCYGFAIDIGTTKLAGYLVNLKEGEAVSTVSSLNPQTKFGADIISRIAYAMKGEEALAKLNRSVVDGINKLIREACQLADLLTQDVIDVSVAGNTAMHHIFLGISPRYLSLSPYPAVLRRGLEMRATDLGLETAPDSRVYMFPIIAGFVGGDAVADIIATGMHSTRELSMLIDIGTNAEIVLGNRNWLVACSCASGPAFEGAHIKHGMRAAEGAIERIWIDPQTLNVSYKTVNGVKPVGICGSAIVEGVAEMFRVGILDSRGRMRSDRGAESLRGADGSMEIVIAWKRNSGIDDDIVITQSDVREIQLAKAAVYTGIAILMKHMHIKPRDIERVFLAGAFGTYIDPASARNIGMFPEISLGKIHFVGNTAGSGARMALISSQTRKLAERIASKVEYVELGADPDFQREFISAIDLPNAKKELFPTVSKIIEQNYHISESEKN
jgi:uncharacterized 2Fe-2S/4Fe-4S cluster protein (DUF4445 family)